MAEYKGQKVKGIVLKRINHKEADRILTVYTDELGKITVIAKGIRKINSKKRGHLEPLTHTTLYLIKTGDWYLVTQSESIDSFSKVKSDQQKINAGILIAEALDKTTEDGDPNKILLDLIVKTLNFTNGEYYLDICAAYLIKLLKINGFYNINQFKNFILRTDTNEFERLFNYVVLLERSTYEDIARRIEQDLSMKDLSRKTINLMILYFEMYADIKLKSFDTSVS